MKTIVLFTACLAVMLGSVSGVYGGPRAEAPDMSLRDTLEELKGVYTTDIVLGKPLEIEGLKIIPLATVGIGYGQRQSLSNRGTMLGAGGVLSPVGVIVVSAKGVQLLPISKGLVEQLLGAITPVVLQVIRGLRQAPEDAGEVTRQRWNPTEILAALYALLPQGGLQFGLFPWPLTLVLIFLAGWLVLALLIGVFLPWPVTAIAATLQEHTLRTGLVGVLSYGVVLILAAVFTVSIIGIPLTVMVLVLAWGAQLLGMVSIAALVGRHSTTAMRRPDYSNVVCILIGGIILGLVRIIPVFGWIAWLLLGIFGFGAVILTQGRAVRGGELGATGI